MLTPDIDFGVSEQLDVLDDPQYLSQHSEADSLSTIEQNDSQASLAMYVVAKARGRGAREAKAASSISTRKALPKGPSTNHSTERWCANWLPASRPVVEAAQVPAGACDSYSS